MVNAVVGKHVIHVKNSASYLVPNGQSATVTLLVGDHLSVATKITISCAAGSTLFLFLGITAPTTLCIDLLMEGEGSSASVNGLYMLKGDENLTLNIRQYHQVPYACTKVLVKGVLTDYARVQYEGTIVVDADAQGTVAANHNKNFMLSPHARALSRPQLEVSADDVSCKHGSAVSTFDADQMTYIQSRGAACADAQRLLLEAFCADVVGLEPTFHYYWLQGRYG